MNNMLYGSAQMQCTLAVMLKVLENELQAPHWLKLLSPHMNSTFLEHITPRSQSASHSCLRAVETLDIERTDHGQVKCAQVVGTIRTARLPRTIQRTTPPYLRARPW